ncbi:MAG: 50S ribosomal protein L1 [Verrucomicrobiae bacterium]|nr:50S ribosomal protein L1 [Verrucomicrobiae bacterium]
MPTQVHGKRYREALKLVDPKKIYPLSEAVAILKKMPKAKFDETVTLAFKLGVDPKQSDQMVRGTCPLPHGSGKKVRVVVFAKGEQAKAAKDAGADEVGFEEMVKKVQGGWTDFDVAIATPDAMQEVRKLGKVLGPRGLMPNPKTGTVTEDTAKAVKEFQAGRVEFKIDKAANVHVPFGKASFAEKALIDNAHSVISAVLHAKPATAKGHYVQSCTVSSSMGPGLKVEIHDHTAAA